MRIEFRVGIGQEDGSGQPAISFLGAQFYKLKLINQRLTSLAADLFYAISQAEMSKSLPEAIYFRCELILGGLLENLGINDNSVIYEIPNGIASPSSLWYVVNKYREDSFMRVAGFVCNYP